MWIIKVGTTQYVVESELEIVENVAYLLRGETSPVDNSNAMPFTITISRK